jgi:hypothetical protein
MPLSGWCLVTVRTCAQDGTRRPRAGRRLIECNFAFGGITAANGPSEFRDHGRAAAPLVRYAVDVVDAVDAADRAQDVA